MPNMGYCRFENTLGDLRACYGHMEDEGLSRSEEKARRALVKLCREIADDYEGAFESDDEAPK